MWVMVCRRSYDGNGALSNFGITDVELRKHTLYLLLNLSGNTSYILSVDLNWAWGLLRCGKSGDVTRQCSQMLARVVVVPVHYGCKTLARVGLAGSMSLNYTSMRSGYKKTNNACLSDH
jgi:hypothetical protein